MVDTWPMCRATCSAPNCNPLTKGYPRCDGGGQRSPAAARHKPALVPWSTSAGVWVWVAWISRSTHPHPARVGLTQERVEVGTGGETAAERPGHACQGVDGRHVRVRDGQVHPGVRIE